MNRRNKLSVLDQYLVQRRLRYNQSFKTLFSAVDVALASAISVVSWHQDVLDDKSILQAGPIPEIYYTFSYTRYRGGGKVFQA